MPDRPFLQRVRDSLPVLHPAERRLAGFLLNFPGELAAYTARELAGLANVSAPTVSRFVQRLGYTSYEEARRHVRADQRSGAALYMVASRQNTPEAALQAHQRQAIANIDATFAALPQSEIDAVAQAILAARRVWLVGFRTSQPLAAYLYWQIYQVCPNTVVVPQAGQTMAEHLSAVEPGDCVVVVALARRVRAMPLLLDSVAQTGAATLLISDEGMARQPAMTWHFQCATMAPGPLFGHVAVMLLLQLLATRVVELSGPAGRKRLSAIEALHTALDEI